MTSRNKINNIILQEINNQGLKAKTVAEQSNVTMRYIHYIMRGERTVSEIDIAERILASLGLKLEVVPLKD